MPNFVRDVEEIRRRASEKIDQGAVTPGYKGDVEKTISILNEALATEIVCVLRYQHHYFMATGVHGKGVADEFVSCPDVQDKDAFAARIHGDSMTPKYREGDIVIFSPSLSPKDGDDCFVRFEDGHTTFKRVFFESADGGAQ